MVRRSLMDDWLAMWRGAMGAAETGLKMIEVGQASAEVIARRCQTIAEAARDPLGADHREIARMVPEKVDALGRAGLSLWADVAAVQAETQAAWLQAASLAMRGKAIGPDHLAATHARAVRVAERSMAASGRALAPVHAKVTGNAARLRRARKDVPSSP